MRSDVANQVSREEELRFVAYLHSASPSHPLQCDSNLTELIQRHGKEYKILRVPLDQREASTFKTPSHGFSYIDCAMRADFGPHGHGHPSMVGATSNYQCVELVSH